MSDHIGKFKIFEKGECDQQNDLQTKKPIEESTKTLLDLNQDELDKIFNSFEYLSDKINLAMTHPYLTQAFVMHAQHNFKNIYITYFTEEDLSIIMQICGEEFRHLKVVDSHCGIDELGVNQNYRTIAKHLNIVITDCPQNKLGPLPFKRLEISFGEMNVVLNLISSFLSLGKYVYVTSDKYCTDTIRSTLESLSKCEKTPGTPYLELTHSIIENVAEILYTKRYKSKLSNIVNINTIDEKEYDWSRQCMWIRQMENLNNQNQTRLVDPNMVALHDFFMAILNGGLGPSTSK